MSKQPPFKKEVWWSHTEPYLIRKPGDKLKLYWCDHRLTALLYIHYALAKCFPSDLDMAPGHAPHELYCLQAWTLWDIPLKNGHFGL